MTAPPGWHLPPDVLAAVADAAGFAVDDPPLVVASALRSWLPMGSTGKLDAIARGERPPGLDPVAVASARLGEWTTSWSCWATATLLAAVLGAGGHRVRILALHRRDPGSQSFDLHSAMVVDEELVLDPYLGPFAAVPLPAGGAVVDGSAAMAVTVVDGRVLDVDVVATGWSSMAYRVVTDDVDPALLAGILDVSVSFSGVPFERYTQWATATEVVRVGEREGVARWRRFALDPDAGEDGPAPLVEERMGPFEELVDDLATHAGWRRA